MSIANSSFKTLSRASLENLKTFVYPDAISTRLLVY